MHWLATEDDIAMTFKIGDRITISALEMVERQTNPPGYLTESELIGLVSIYWNCCKSEMKFICSLAFISRWKNMESVPMHQFRCISNPYVNVIMYTLVLDVQ